jgi:hypothetical protein
LAGLTKLEGFCSIQSLDFEVFQYCDPHLLYEKTKSKQKLKEGGGNEKIDVVLMMLLGMAQAGCEFISGAAVGAGAAGAGYEYNAYRQMQQLEEDYKNEKISSAEYEKRKQQIEAGSIIY